MSQITPLFSMPMYSHQLSLDNCPDYTATKFSEFYDLSQSQNHCILDLPEWQDLRSQIDQCLEEFFHQYLLADPAVSLAITDSWINRYAAGQAQPRHFHSNSVFSGVVMLCDHPSAITFYTPHRSNYKWAVTNNNLWNSGHWRMPCSQGLIIITPSTLDHETQINSTDQYRWSLAFDTQIEGDPRWRRQVDETVANIAKFSS